MKKRILFILLLLVCAAHARVAMAQQQGPSVIVLTSGTSWNPPTNWNNSAYKIYAFGAGNNGAVGTSTTRGGGGGASGDFADLTQASGVTFTHGTPVTIQIGAHGGGVTTTGATFLGAATCAGSNLCAAGGAAPSTNTGGTAGNTANDVGTDKFAGCAGGNNAANLQGGGGGGGMANNIGTCGAGANTSTTANGANGGVSAEGAVIAPVGVAGTATTQCTVGSQGQIYGAIGAIPSTGLGSGSGGGGGSTNSAHFGGCAGGAFGAGGGGAGQSGGTGGNGANGALIITWWPTSSNGKVVTDISSTCAHTSATVTLPLNVTAGDSVLVGGCMTASGSSPHITSVSCTHSSCTMGSNAGAGTTVYSNEGFCPYDTGGTDVCTFSFSNSGTNCVHTFYAVEQPSLNSIDVSTGNVQASTGTPLSGNLVTTNGNDVVLGFSCVDNAGVVTSGPPDLLGNLGAYTLGGASDPTINASTTCTANGVPFTCCTGNGTGNCTFDQIAVSGINLPNPVATATFTMGFDSTISANAANSVMGLQLVATATATATPTATPTPSCTNPVQLGGRHMGLRAACGPSL